MQPSAPAHDAVRSRYGDTRHLVFVLVGGLVFGGLGALGVHAFVSGGFEDGATKAIGGVITGFFVVGFLLCVLAAVLFPSRRHRLPGVAVDGAGVWWYRDRRVTLVPWSDIAGVGLGYLRAPGVAVAAGASSGRPKNLAFEVFLRTPHVLRSWAAAEPPPRPDLPAERLRFVLPAGGDGHALRAAVARHAPRLWVGEYRREWTPLGVLEQ